MIVYKNFPVTQSSFRQGKMEQFVSGMCML